MKSFLFALILSLPLMGATVLSPNGAYEINRSSAVARKYAMGTQLLSATQFGVKAQWSYAVSGGASGDIPLLDHEGRPVKLPTGAIITNCLIDVVTRPTSSTSSGKLSLSSSAVADLKAATFVNSWSTSSRTACIPDGTTGNMIKMASEATLKIRVGSEAVTAGKINVWVEYVLSE